MSAAFSSRRSIWTAYRALVQTALSRFLWAIVAGLSLSALGCGTTPATPDAHVPPDTGVLAPDAPDAAMMCLPAGSVCVLAEDCCSMGCLVADPMVCL
jgi:hypothetical protein